MRTATLPWLAAFCITVVSGCSTEPGNTPILFRVRVDSVQVPSSVCLNDTIAIRLFGTIGGDGCYSFSHFEASRQAHILSLTVWGKLTPASVCPAVMVYLDGKEFRFVANDGGTQYINIHQPDGSKLVDSVRVSVDGNLLTNGSFEMNGAPSLQGWKASTADTSFVNFSSDVPPQSGSFSVRLRNEWVFPGSLWQGMRVPSGTHRYRLSAFGRVIPIGMRAGGRVEILVKRASSWMTSKYLSLPGPAWTPLSLVDTLTTVSGDSIAILLSGSAGQHDFGYALFDLVRFERLD
jgi:hypothetical protein